MRRYLSPLIAIFLFSAAVAIGLWTEVINVPFLTGREKFGEFSLKVHRERYLYGFLGGFAANWSSDGSELAVVNNWGSTLTVWDNAGHKLGERTRAGGGGPYLSRSVSFVQDNYHLVVEPVAGGMENEAFSVWNTSPWQLVARVVGPNLTVRSANKAEQFVLSPDGGLLLMTTGRPNSHIKDTIPNVAIYRTDDWQLLHTINFPGIVWAVSMCADGQSAVLGASDGQGALVNLTTGEISNTFRPFHGSILDSAGVNAVACSPHGEFIFGGVQSPKSTPPVPSTLEIGNKSAGPATVMRVSDGATVASIYDVRTPIQQAVWDPKGRYVAFIDDRRLVVWQPLATSTGYERIDLGGPTFSLAVSPDGEHIAATTGSGVRIFSIE